MVNSYRLKRWRGLLIMLSAIVSAGCSFLGIRSEETPKYRVILKEESKEIRYYEPYIVARTTVKGDFKAAQGEAFRILAGYIFGGNVKGQEIPMTAPVVQKPTGESEKISMTAPVIQRQSEEGWVMDFMMPSVYEMEDLPAPKDRRVRLERVPARYIAALRYNWLGSESRNKGKADELKKWLSGLNEYETISPPMYAGYDPPWTIPFLRRNETMVELKKRPIRH
jgi:hypothetical protein